MTLGMRLRARRKALGMTQMDVVLLTGIPQCLLSRLEGDYIKNPGADYLKRLARALGCSIDYLVGLYDDPAPTAPPLALVES